MYMCMPIYVYAYVYVCVCSKQRCRSRSSQFYMPSTRYIYALVWYALKAV